MAPIVSNPHACFFQNVWQILGDASPGQPALRKRPDDPVSYAELSDIQFAQKKVDAALYNYRRTIESVRALSDPAQKLPSSGDLTGSAIADACAQRLLKLDKPVVTYASGFGHSAYQNLRTDSFAGQLVQPLAIVDLTRLPTVAAK